MRFLQRSWDILSQHLSKAYRPLLIILLFLLFFLTTPHLQAIHDTNQNGVSDLWEKKFNSGALYPTFNPTADPDADGWTNAQEAAVGTDPTTGAGPTGYVRPQITRTPAVYLTPAQPGGAPQLVTPEVMTITWPTVAGKKYTLLFSTDLTAGNWTAIGDPRIGAGTEIGTSIPLTQPDGSPPGALFWRVTIADEDTDSDTLTNAEEAELGSNSSSADGDGDGLSDVDELFVYHTNPSSPDTDGDGVSDSEEIASGHNPQSNQSYPPRLNIALRSASTGASNAKGSLYSNWPPYFFQEIQRSDIGVSTLPTRVATMPFPDQAPDNLLRAHQKGSSWDGAAPFYGLVQDASDGMLTQSRYWLQTKPVSNVEIKRTFLKVTTCYRMTYSPLTEVFPPIVEKLEVTIPANSTASLPIDIMPPLNFPPGFYTSIGNRVTLVPVEVVVRKKDEAPPTDGMLAKVGDTLVYEITDDPASFPLPASAVTWEWRKLKGDGTLGSWTTFSSGFGPRVEALESGAGIFQIRVKIVAGGSTHYFGYSRKVDDPYGKDSHGTMNPIYKAGQPDCVGIAAGDSQLKIAKEARSVKGSTVWALSAIMPITPAITAPSGANKCNVFIYHMATRAGSTVPLDAGGWPPRAYDWYDSGKAISGWTWRSDSIWAEPGTMVSRYIDGDSIENLFDWGFRWPSSSAHCGIIDYDGAWINAGSKNVNRYPHLTSSGYQTAYTRKN